MVVRIQLNIRHIRGHTFPVEADIDSEILGVKLQIWESQKIPIEKQRLVFSGKELEDNVVLSQMNIGDGATIFLVESMSDIPQQPQSEIPQVTIQVPEVITPATTNACQQQCANNVLVATIAGNVNYYAPLEIETELSEERIKSVIDLAHWVRLYCIFGMVISALYCMLTLYALILVVVYLLGFIGTRIVSRCLLVFPLLACALIGGFEIYVSMYHFVHDFNGLYFINFFIGLLHLMIMTCIYKLIFRMSRLYCQEWCQTRMRMRTRGCFCSN